MKITTLFFGAHRLYTGSMKAVTAHYPPLRPVRVQYAAWLATGMLVLMLLAQLFSFENFVSILALVLAYNDQQLVAISTALVTAAELFALPYLLGMKLSSLMRVLSAALGGAVVLFWLFTSLTNAHAENSALFGDTLALPGGIVAVLWSLVLIGAYVYVVIHERRRVATS